MTELDDTLVSGEFAAFREAYAPAVRAAGTATVRQTVRRRRRRAVLATAAAVVVAVAVPVSAAALQRPDPTPGPAQTGTPTPSGTTGSPPPTPAPSTASPTTAPAVPDGRISRAQLLAARPDLPAWPSYTPATCVDEDVRLRSGTQNESVPTLLAGPVHGDVDGDGATETVALISCRYGEASAKQVVAFDRDAAGRIVTMGRVIGTRTGLEDVTDFEVLDDGQVRVHVADIQPCCDTPQWKPQRQWRTYAWADDRFAQAAGPTGFGTDARLTDLTLNAGSMAVTAPDATGDRTATVTVTVTNRGPVGVPLLGFSGLGFEEAGVPAGGVLERCREVRSSGAGACVLDSLAAGARRTYTFSFHYRPTPGVTPSLRVIHYDAQERWWDDLKPKDNTAELRPAQ